MWWFEFGEGDIFMGKVHNGDTIGIVYTEEYFQYYSKIKEFGTQKLTIYPNPISNGQILQVNLDSQISEYSIYTIAGKKVLVENSSSNEIFINSLTSGIYIIEIKTKDNTFREKLIIR
jgi:hypothetical protein